MTTTPTMPARLCAAGPSLHDGQIIRPSTRIAKVACTDPGEGFDAVALAAELARRWNAHDKLIEALYIMSGALSVMPHRAAPELRAIVESALAQAGGR